MQHHSSYEKAAFLYDLFDNKPNVEFFCRYAQHATRVLDIGAGTGRIAIPLAEKGVQVYCIEPSPAMRAVFIDKLSANDVLAERISLIGADVGSFALKNRFPVVTMSGVFDHLIGDGERVCALQNIRDHLVPKGKLAFDAFVGDLKESPLVAAGDCTIGHREYRRYVGRRVISEDIVELSIVFEIHDHGELVVHIEERGLVGVVHREQLLGLITRSGFTVVNEYGAFDCRPYQDSDELLIIEALRK